MSALGGKADIERQLEPVMREMQGKSYSMRRMATELNKRKVKTPRGVKASTFDASGADLAVEVA